MFPFQYVRSEHFIKKTKENQNFEPLSNQEILNVDHTIQTLEENTKILDGQINEEFLL